MTDADPFAHHPELRDKIVDVSEAAYYRRISVESFFGDRPDLTWVAALMYSDAAREALRAQTLSRHPGGDLWVFAYGSLMWNPALYFAEVRRAHVAGYARQFSLKDIYGARGTREVPGLMAALDREPGGAGCDGLAFRIAAERVETETEVLWRREMIGPGYEAVFVEAALEDRTVRALTFVADHGTDMIDASLSFDEQVEMIARGEGFLGTSHDYLVNVVDNLRTLGIHDPACEALLDAVEAARAR